MSDQFEFDLEADDKQLIVEANEIVWSQTLDWIKKYDSMIIAANMLNSALRLYKTSLSCGNPIFYNKLVKFFKCRKNV